MSNTATLKYKDKNYDLKIIRGSEGEEALDIKHLRKETGLISLDPGMVNTGSTESSITFIDGDKGILRYRGYNIAELCEKSDYLEVAYLLIFGELPNKKELENFNYSVTRHTMISEEYKKYFDVWPQTAQPMAILASAVALYCMRTISFFSFFKFWVNFGLNIS